MATAPPHPSTRPFSDLVLDFLAYLDLERGLSRNTLEAYRTDLQQFGVWLEEPGRCAGDRAAQGGLPALLLPPPPPRGDHRSRPHRGAARAARRAQAAARA